MAENIKMKVLVVGDRKPTIQGGLEIMAKGLKDWHDSVNPPPECELKSSRQIAKREAIVFPPACVY